MYVLDKDYYCKYRSDDDVPNEIFYPKKDVPNETAHILLSCKRCKDEQKMYFRIKRSAPLQKLMNAYRAKYPAEAKSTLFMYGGRKINANSTADEMEDGDVIYAFPRFYCGCQICKIKHAG